MTASGGISCHLCPYVGVAESDLKIHLSHHGKKKKGVRCQLCTYTANTANGILIHVQRDHGRAPPTPSTDEEEPSTIEVIAIFVSLFKS